MGFHLHALSCFTHLGVKGGVYYNGRFLIALTSLQNKVYKINYLPYYNNNTVNTHYISNYWRYALSLYSWSFLGNGCFDIHIICLQPVLSSPMPMRPVSPLTIYLWIIAMTDNSGVSCTNPPPPHHHLTTGSIAKSYNRRGVFEAGSPPNHDRHSLARYPIPSLAVKIQCKVRLFLYHRDQPQLQMIR